MDVKKKEKITPFILYGEKGPLDIIDSLNEAGVSEIETIALSSLRPAAYFSFIKNEDGRPYYGREGIDFYLRRLRERK